MLTCILLALFALNLRAEEITGSKDKKPVIISIETHHYFGGNWGGERKDCPVKCLWKTNVRDQADGLWYHAPSHHSPVEKSRPSQVSIVSSMESAGYYSHLLDKSYMGQFDLKMTYMLDSDAIMSYFDSKALDEVQAVEPLPFEEKLDAVIFVNSNCYDKSGRTEIVQKLMSLGVPVHARGGCLNNYEKIPHGTPRKDVMRKYKFCISMENSRSKDYVSEKLFDAWRSGCLPIYYGAPNIEDFLPLPDAVIDYQKVGSPEALATLINSLMHNKTAYEQYFRYKKMQLKDLAPRYLKTRQLLSSGIGAECKVCMLVDKMRSERLQKVNKTSETI